MPRRLIHNATADSQETVVRISKFNYYELSFIKRNFCRPYQRLNAVTAVDFVIIEIM